MDLLKIAIKAALEASKRILEIYEKDFKIHYKKDKSPLTSADLASNEIIKEYLLETGFPILSEEEKNIEFKIRKNWKRLWIVDPIDGTKEFIKKNGEFTVNIALVENGIPIIGVVVAPVLNKIYFSEKNLGAYKFSNIEFESYDIKNILTHSKKLPQNKLNSIFTIVASRSHMSKETEEFIEKMKKTHGEVKLITSGSSLKICLVAEGKADAYPRFAPTMEWDTAAGQAICDAAGYKLIDKKTNSSMTYNRKKLQNNFFLVC